MIEFDENRNLAAKVKIIGIGGGGNNALNTMISYQLTGVEFIAANTDAQALAANLAPMKLQLGTSLTKGLGAGANPGGGRTARQSENGRRPSDHHSKSTPPQYQREEYDLAGGL